MFFVFFFLLLLSYSFKIRDQAANEIMKTVGGVSLWKCDLKLGGITLWNTIGRRKRKKIYEPISSLYVAQS